MPSARTNHVLSHAPPDCPLGSPVVHYQRLVPRSTQRTLGRGLHPPRVGASDDQDSHCIAHSRTYFAHTLAAASDASTAPRAPSRNPMRKMNIEMKRAGGLKMMAAIETRLPRRNWSSAHQRL